jgi:toxin YoeB
MSVRSLCACWIWSKRREPFSGAGKPEPLRFQFAGCWSRRIAGEHRLVYRVTGSTIEFLQARYHYE